MILAVYYVVHFGQCSDTVVFPRLDCVYGNAQHKNLSSQFTLNFVSSDEGSYILFNGWNRKTFNGGLEHCRFVPRSINLHFDNGDDRCVFKIFKLYLSMIPLSGSFY